MTDIQRAEDALETLRDILREEHDALLAGRAGTASALLPAKMKAMEVFDEVTSNQELIRKTPGFRERLGEIVTLSKENAAHFAAVRNGVNSVISRMSTMSTTAYVGAYGADGGKTAFSKAVGGYEKKV
ncbi:hypothetical protein [Henriciella litoralis]|uniref:hypothetical protein n=1 Tax=Henriciella litoralis TaxID=568102 RepID=UPI000A02041B|nr:hypothetical protein [Henriciella litoralis]